MTTNEYDRRVVRLSIDVDAGQRAFLRGFALKSDISISIVVRALIYLLETDPELGHRVLDEIFMAPEVEVDLDALED